MRAYKIISETVWGNNKTTSRPNRGIMDYEKTIAFSRELTDVELEGVCKSLHSDPDCPGWTPVRGRKLDQGKAYCIYRFYTCYDSSD